MPRRWIRQYEPPAAWITTQVCFIAILVVILGLALGGLAAFVYALLKGLNL